MALLYDRHETHETVEYRFHFLPAIYITLGIAVAVSIASRGERTNESLGTFGLLVLAWVIGAWEPLSEIQRAMTHGRAEVSGSKFSFSNPMRVTLRKQDALGGNIPGAAAAWIPGDE